MPTKPNQRGGDRESTLKRIQNNDSKDGPKCWKQNGVTNRLETMIEKMQEMVNKDLEEIKESINKEQCNNWDQKHSGGDQQ